MTKPPMHWSLVPQFHDLERAEAYKRGVYTLMREYAGRSADAPDGTARYAVLATYLDSPNADAEVPTCGEAEVERTAVCDGFAYSIRYENHISGECLRLEFRTLADRFRSLTGEWRIRTENRAAGSYNTFSCTGRMERQGEKKTVRLTFDTGLTIAPATLAGDAPATANWALPDLLAQGGLRDCDRFAILDDLEKTCTGNRLLELGSWHLPGGAGGGVLHGLCVQGPHRNPAFYWFDDAQQVALFGNTSYTFVRIPLRNE